MRIDPVSGEVLAGPLEPIYVYEAPVRLWHWVMMIAMFVLAGTGSFTNRNDTSQLTATANFTGGSTQEVSNSATWATSNAAVASVTSTGTGYTAIFEPDATETAAVSATGGYELEATTLAGSIVTLQTGTARVVKDIPAATPAPPARRTASPPTPPVATPSCSPSRSSSAPTPVASPPCSG